MVFIGSAAVIGAPSPEVVYLKEHYTKYEYKIPMRDGVRLFTAVYVPKDTDKRYPILLTRTPYSLKPYGEDVYAYPHGPMNYYAKEGFIFALQDVRGRYSSEGKFVHVRPLLDDKSGANDIDESTDAYDTIDWLVKNVSGNNGRVGMIGISYPGFYAACGMVDSHPALKCVSPQAPVSDWFMGDDFHHNGCLFLDDAFGFLGTFEQKLDDPTRESPKPFDYKTPDGYEFYLSLGPLPNADRKYFKGKIAFWDEIMAHPTYDAWWRARRMPSHLKNIHTAVMTVGGWNDAEDLYGTLNVYRETERRNPGIYNVLVMGPWSHGEWSAPKADHLGHVNFDANTAKYYRDHFELPFLIHFLKGDAADNKSGGSSNTGASAGDEAEAKKFNLAEANVFETGTNQWRHFDAWPPKNTVEKSLYLHSGGRLSFDAPTADEKSAFDQYISDPAKPVPYIGSIALDRTAEYMVDDQRFAATRPDVLVYQTDVLTSDVTFAGPISARLEVSTSGTDSDFVVKLIDVYSNNFPNPDPNPKNMQMGEYQQLVRGEPMRGKFRNSYEKPEPFTPGQQVAMNWTMPDVFHTFRRGHRIMIQVQSSWFPLIDRNPQTFCDINRATADDFQKATERVYHSPQAASAVHVRVLMPTAN
ncbi:MAG TPA: CocE/NonD family hydrolase [Lacipirellulaceae bacterium]|nr:CocE/NonD family hydrolase [Lacipirellulaceae bacterium]